MRTVSMASQCLGSRTLWGSTLIEYGSPWWWWLCRDRRRRESQIPATDLGDKGNLFWDFVWQSVTACWFLWCHSHTCSFLRKCIPPFCPPERTREGRRLADGMGRRLNKPLPSPYSFIKGKPLPGKWINGGQRSLHHSLRPESPGLLRLGRSK